MVKAVIVTTTLVGTTGQIVEAPNHIDVLQQIRTHAREWVAQLEDDELEDTSLFDGGPMWLTSKNSDYTFNAALIG